MQTSLYSQLVTLNLKLDTGLKAIDHLSQLLGLFIMESIAISSSASSAQTASDSTLSELLTQLTGIRQLLHHAYTGQDLSLTEPFEGLPQASGRISPQDIEDHQLVGDHEVVSLHHKDVLEDEDFLSISEHGGHGVSSDMQVRRLMAQLTAAYNRIAALEEQLLFSPRPSYVSEDLH